MDDEGWLRGRAAELKAEIQERRTLLEHIEAALEDKERSQSSRGAGRANGTLRAIKSRHKSVLVRAAIETMTGPWDVHDLRGALSAAGHDLSVNEILAVLHRLRKRREIQVHTRAAGHVPAKYQPGLSNPAKGKAPTDAADGGQR